MKKRDIEAYIDFVVRPPKSWIGTQIQRRFHIKNGILSVLYNHLVEEDYAFGNAVATVKKPPLT